MAVLVARTAWYGLLAPGTSGRIGRYGLHPSQQKFFGRTTRWYGASSRRYHAVVGMNGESLCLLEPPPGRHRSRYAERQPKSAIGWLPLKISLGIAGS